LRTKALHFVQPRRENFELRPEVLCFLFSRAAKSLEFTNKKFRNLPAEVTQMGEKVLQFTNKSNSN
jgi:hypothetical protein